MFSSWSIVIPRVREWALLKQGAGVPGDKGISERLGSAARPGEVPAFATCGSWTNGSWHSRWDFDVDPIRLDSLQAHRCLSAHTHPCIRPTTSCLCLSKRWARTNPAGDYACAPRTPVAKHSSRDLKRRPCAVSGWQQIRFVSILLGIRKAGSALARCAYCVWRIVPSRPDGCSSPVFGVMRLPGCPPVRPQYI